MSFFLFIYILRFKALYDPLIHSRGSSLGWMGWICLGQILTPVSHPAPLNVILHFTIATHQNQRIYISDVQQKIIELHKLVKWL